MIGQELLEHQSNPPAHDCRRVWHVGDFLEIQSIVGRDRAETLLRGYALHLEFAATSIRDAASDARPLREIVHNLKAMSGQLGFNALHDVCDAIATSAETVDADRVMALLLLIGESREAAQSHGRRTKNVETGRAA